MILLLSRGELDDLERHLDQVADLAVRLAIDTTGATRSSWPRGPITRHQPGPRPPTRDSAEFALDDLCNALTDVVDRICTHRHMNRPDLSVVACARWLKRHRTIIGLMPDARDLHHKICSAIDHAASTLDLNQQTSHYISPAMREQANRTILTAQQIVRLAPTLGAQAEGLTYERIRTLRRRGLLDETATDSDSGTHFYRLGDVLQAHEQHRRRTTLTSANPESTGRTC